MGNRSEAGPDPDTMFIAWQGFAGADGTVVKRGERFKGSHRVVQAYPWNFVADGDLLPDPQREAALQVDS